MTEPLPEPPPPGFQPPPPGPLPGPNAGVVEFELYSAGTVNVAKTSFPDFTITSELLFIEPVVFTNACVEPDLVGYVLLPPNASKVPPVI